MNALKRQLIVQVVMILTLFDTYTIKNVFVLQDILITVLKSVSHVIIHGC